MKYIPLTQFQGSAEIIALSDAGKLGRRLLDLGFVPGSRVKRLYQNRQISAYQVGESVIALRDCDACAVCCIPPRKEEL